MDLKGIRIIFEDDSLLVCFKPAGLPVQTAKLGTADMESVLKNYLREKFPDRGEPYLGIIHRLDQPVKGLVVFALTAEAAAKMSAQTAGRGMEKIYLARVWDHTAAVKKKGGPPAVTEDGYVLLEDLLWKNSRTNTSMVAAPGTKGAKKARLLYKDISSPEEYPELASAGQKLLRIRLLTGRHHQIRVQLSAAGMPIVGDRKYADADTAGTATADAEERFPALCACNLAFVHPKTGKECRFSLEEEILWEMRFP